MSDPGPERSATRQAFGHYTLLEELGRGGQGTVWLAEDHNLKRKVALKLLRTAAGTIDEHQLERFRREAEAASKLDHPNICALFDAGDVDGVPYLAFRHIEGETLAERVTSAQESDSAGASATSKEGIQTTVALFEKLARALHKAHEQGLIHRDVKPGNVMVTPDGEPIVLDFGLARDELADEQTLTHSGDLLGTPAYMSPEQLMANRVPLDRRTDVYSLGATLYECLTLQRPFGAPTRAELYQKILHSEPSSASSTNRQIPRDLQVIVETAMEKDRNRRYQTGEDFAEDLRRFREFEPIRARPIGRLLRVKRWRQRHPAASVAMAALFLAFAASVITLLNRQALLRHTRSVALSAESFRAGQTDQMLGLMLALAAVRTEKTPESLSQLYQATADVHEDWVYSGHTDGVVFASFSKQGDRVVTASRDGTARVWPIRGSSPIAELRGHESWVNLARFSDDGKLVATASNDHTARVWDARTGQLISGPFEHADYVEDVAFSSDGKFLLTASADKTARLWRLADSSEQQVCRHGSGVWRVLFSPHDAKKFLTVAGATVFHDRRDNTAKLWTIDDSEPVTLAGHTHAILDAAFSPSDPNKIATASLDGTVRVWSVGEDAQVPEVLPHGAVVRSVRFSPDGTRLLTATSNGKASLWSLDGEKVRTFEGTRGVRLNSAEFSAKGDRILIAAADNTIRLHVVDGRELPVLRAHKDEVVGAMFAPNDDHLILSWSQDKTARLWNTNRAKPPVLPRHWGRVRVAFSSTGKHIVTRSTEDGIRIWNREGKQIGDALLVGVSGRLAALSCGPEPLLIAAGSGDSVLLLSQSGEQLRAEQGFDGFPFFVGFSPNDDVVVATNSGHTRVFTQAGELALDLVAGAGATVDPHRPASFGLSYSPSRERLVSAHACGVARLWSKEGEFIDEIAVHEGRVFSAVFGPSGKTVLTASEDGTAALWSLDGKPLQSFRHDGAVNAAVFSPDGQQVATASDDATVRVWSVDGGLQFVLRGHQGPVKVVAWSGDLIATSGDDGNVRLWFADPANLIPYASERAFREFTPDELMRYGALLGDADG